MKPKRWIFVFIFISVISSSLLQAATPWLHVDANQINDDLDHNCCLGADFTPADGVVDFLDLNNFAIQWMMCNDPANPDCTQNW